MFNFRIQNSLLTVESILSLHITGARLRIWLVQVALDWRIPSVLITYQSAGKNCLMAICNPLPKEFRGGIVFLYSALWLVKKSLTPCLNQSDAKLWGRGRLALPRRREPPFVKHAYRVLISLTWFYSTGTCDFVTQGCSS